MTKSFCYKIIIKSKQGHMTEFFCDNSDVVIEHLAVSILDYKNSSVTVERGVFYVL